MNSTPNRQVFYGWKVVTALLVMLTFATGLSFYNHAVILNALAQQPAFTVQSASIAVSLFFLSGGVAGLWVARWVNDYDPRFCISFGALICGASLAGLALITKVWQLYVLYLIFGVGFSASNLVPATTLVTRWFHKKRAMALSIASTGLSLGGVIITPICAVLVESLGLGRAAPVMGLMYVAGVVPVSLIWLRPSPESMGLQPDDDQTSENETQGTLSSDPFGETSSNSAGDQVAQKVASQPVKSKLPAGVSFRDARRGRLFWAMSTAYIFLMMAQVGGISHQYGLARELLDESQTALVVAILPIASIVGRLAGGWVIEQLSIRSFAIGMMILQVVSLLLLSGGYNPFTLCLGLASFGITVGNLLMLQPLLIAEAFGVREYPRIFAVSNFMSSWGTASGPAALGLVYATSSNLYGAAYLLAAAAGLAGLALFLAGGPLKRS
ncbi:MAG: MFS transporter [Gammaproteobacteria bacterium]|nr:MFS transporter [Gammaproteobacteria bacterium]